MDAIRLLHVSDTHLSPTHAYFADNGAVFRDLVRADPPDLLVHGGDISFNGPALEADLVYASAEIAGLGVDWLAIAGNHDVG